MEIEPFRMERMQSVWENRVSHNLSESGVHPLSVAELLGEEGWQALLDQRLVYVQSNGSEALRAAIAALYPGAGVENVLVCNGTAEANHVSLWRLVEPGDEVVMMLPNYMQAWGLVRGFGAVVVPFRLRAEDDWAPDLAGLERAIGPRTRLIAVCQPNNPTGAVLTEEQVDAIVGVARRHGLWILADEVYRGAERVGPAAPSFWGRHDRLLVTSGLSKAYGLPGLRIGWVAGPADTVAQLWGRRDYMTIAPGALSDLLGRAALSPARRERILERTRGILRQNWTVLADWLGRRPGLRVTPPKAGAIAYLRYPWPVNSSDLVTRLRDQKSVLVVPGDHFEMDGYLRVGFGNETADLRAGLDRMAELLDTLPAR